jgi:hypothetical protein
LNLVAAAHAHPQYQIRNSYIIAANAMSGSLGEMELGETDLVTGVAGTK